MDQGPVRYMIRIDGHLGATLLSAFPALASRRHGAHTVLTGLLDRAALFGVLAEIEALGLELIEVRQLNSLSLQSFGSGSGFTKDGETGTVIALDSSYTGPCKRSEPALLLGPDGERVPLPEEVYRVVVEVVEAARPEGASKSCRATRQWWAVNLKSYASSQWKSYGSCQRVLEQVWSASRKHRSLVGAFRPRPRRMIFVEQAGERPDAFREPVFIKGPDVPEIRRFKRPSA